jgi:hypothetical protein
MYLIAIILIGLLIREDQDPKRREPTKRLQKEYRVDNGYQTDVLRGI